MMILSFTGELWPVVQGEWHSFGDLPVKAFGG